MLGSNPSILDKECKIDGNISTPGTIEIEGVFKGNIVANKIVLRSSGKIEGNIEVNTISIYGEFNGNINAKSIKLFSKSFIKGEIRYNNLFVEDGACIEGKFLKNKNKEKQDEVKNDI